MLLAIACFIGFVFCAGCTIISKSLFWLLVYGAMTAGMTMVTLSKLEDVIDLYECGISIFLAKILRVVTFLAAGFTGLMFLYNLFT